MNVHPLPPLDVSELRRRTGWNVVAFEEVASTNDEVARLREAGAIEPTIVVADRQREGRGRGGHRFSSPDGGLYASLLVRARPEDLPARWVAMVAVALAEAVEAVTGAPVALKWPNDLWIEEKKVAGILLEASPMGARDAAGTVGVVVGVGVNLRDVPDDLEPAVRAATSALDRHARAPVDRGVLLAHFLGRLDAWRGADGRPRDGVALEGAYRRRLALVGESIRFFVGAEAREAVLRDVSLSRGILVEGPGGERSWLPLEHVREVRRANGGAP